MENLIHADIFFFVATVCFALLTILLAIAIINLIRIIYTVRRITDKAEIESDFILSEMRRVRQRIEIEGFKMSALFRFFRRLMYRYY